MQTQKSDRCEQVLNCTNNYKVSLLTNIPSYIQILDLYFVGGGVRGVIGAHDVRVAQ